MLQMLSDNVTLLSDNESEAEMIDKTSRKRW